MTNTGGFGESIEEAIEQAKVDNPDIFHPDAISGLDTEEKPVETFSVGGSKVEIMNEALGRKRLPIMNIEPNWQGMFDVAINVVRTNIDEKNGGYIALEMLEYGKRLDALYQAENSEPEFGEDGIDDPMSPDTDKNDYGIFDPSEIRQLKVLKEITADCRDDMHEPDESGVTASVINPDGKLDNAFGTDRKWGEIIVRIRNESSGIVDFNLANLIALARKAVL